MNEKLTKLVDLRVKLQLAEKRYDEATEANDLDTIEAEITELKSEIDAVEKEMSEATEVTDAEVKEEETKEEVAEETKEEEKEEVVEETKEESTEEPAEPTSEEVERSAQWTKIDKDNLTQVASYEQRGGKEIMNEELKNQIESRAKDFKEGRSVTVASSNILLPSHESSDLATVPFKQVSSLVDLVKKRNLPGGESYEAPFTKAYGIGGNTEEGAAAATAEPEFDTVEIQKAKITAYAEVSEELEKLPAADYVAEVENEVKVAVKKKIAQEIIAGDGSTNHFVGILSKAAANKCVLEADDLTIDDIDGDTLTEIIFNYGGDEEVEGVATLLLNKLDLLAFAKVRNATNGMREYKIDYNAQTINGVPYIINSNITPLASAAEGDYVMAYGVPNHYEVPVFSDVVTTKSTDYKFKEGMICYKAVVFTGGNTSSYRGFIRAKKGVVTQ